MEPKLIDANGLCFGYLERGIGPLVLLLHGFPDTAHTWDRSMAALAGAGYRAVAPFTRGYYPTQVPVDGAYDAQTLGRDVVGLIEAFGEERAILVGHDWGASAAYAAAALAPSRVRLLIAVALPHPRSIRPSLKVAWTMRHFFQLRRKSAAARVRRNDFALVDELWRRWSPAWKEIAPDETAHVLLANDFSSPGKKSGGHFGESLGVGLPGGRERPLSTLDC